jgi:hypothetical protein
MAAPMSEITSITPRPLRTPPLGTGLQRELHVEQLAIAAQHYLEKDGQAEVQAAGEAEQRQRVRAEVERVLVDEGQRQEQRCDGDAVEVEIAERDPERVRRALGRREEQLRIAQRRLHQAAPGPRPAPRRACSSPQ